MEDLKTILANYHPKKGATSHDIPIEQNSPVNKLGTTSEIPDLFFDHILVTCKLNRIDILLMMSLYRLVWCRPNLHKTYGISPMLSHAELSKKLNISIEDLHHSFRHLESFGLIETIRAGQYFVRKYFTEDYDRLLGQTYDNF